jgi:COP9 signalosome complex subunit 7
MKTGEHEKYYNTINLFAFGTYRNYIENKEKLITLTPIMDKKLKHLTILTLATQKKTLPYDDLMVELDLKNVRQLEDLVIEAIYAGIFKCFSFCHFYSSLFCVVELINGKLDQKNRQLEIDYAVARDIQTENIQELVDILSEWLKSCESCSTCLQEQIENANAEKAKRIKHKEKLEEQLTEVKKNIKRHAATSQQPPIEGMDDADLMMQVSEKNLNKQEKRGGGGSSGSRGPKQGTSKSGAWFGNTFK